MSRPKGAEPTTRTSLHLFERQLDLLRAESLMTGTPMSALVRRVLDKELTVENAK